MGLFSKKPVTTGNDLNELAPVIKQPRQEVFKGTLADIKANPKPAGSGVDSRLEDLNRQTFF
jgi:hypothetical protein